MVVKKDLVILGGGTGGYVAAIRAAQQGRDVTIIERDKLGGTCLHKGCIPSKAMLKSARMMDAARELQAFGIDHEGNFSIDYKKVLKRKESIVEQLYQGVQALMKKHKIEIIEGSGVVQGPSIFTPDSGGVAVTFNDENKEEEIFVPKHLIIATGSRPISLPNIQIDEAHILSSDGMLELEELPKSVAIIGGGVIGCEWASILASLGVEVTIIEAMKTLVPNESRTISKSLKKAFKKQGITLKLKTKVAQAVVEEEGVALTIKGSEETLTVEKVMVAVGRKPNVDGIGLNNTSIKFSDKGIEVNEHYQTAEGHIYAIGDVLDTLQLAHVAMKEGELAVEHMNTGHSEPLNYIHVPRCTYTRPEIASVGYTKDNVPEDMTVKTGVFYLKGNGKALIEGEADGGLVEVLTDTETDDLVGVSIIGPHATDLIAEASTALYMQAATMEIGEAIHPHPTISEAIAEAAMDTEGNAIHK